MGDTCRGERPIINNDFPNPHSFAAKDHAWRPCVSSSYLTEDRDNSIPDHHTKTSSMRMTDIDYVGAYHTRILFLIIASTNSKSSRN